MNAPTEPSNLPLNVEHYRTRLLELEAQLTSRAERAMAAGRGEFIDIAHDSGDASVANEIAAEKFTEAELDSSVLSMIRDALVRVNDGTYGKCVADGRPIDAKRLDAVPWTPYCLHHADGPSSAPKPRRLTL